MCDSGGVQMTAPSAPSSAASAVAAMLVNGKSFAAASRGAGAAS